MLQPSLFTAEGDLMEELLLRFTPLFAKPTGLPRNKSAATTSTCCQVLLPSRSGRIAMSTLRSWSWRGNA
jgi:hypothetical protein